MMIRTPMNVSFHLIWSFQISGLGETTEEGRLLAFEQGRTGYPLVDACMRCLLETGWLNQQISRGLKILSIHRNFHHHRQKPY